MSSQSTPTGASDFGANEWLVDEIYEQFLADPDSVDRGWWEYFKDRSDGQSSPSSPPTPAPAPAPTRVPSAQPARTPPPAAAARPATANGSAPAQAGAGSATRAPTAPTAPTARAKPGGSAPSAGPNHAQAKPTRSRTPNQPPSTDRTDQAPATQAENVPLRGAAARIVTNMAASLEVPTATSVRAIPAKLLIDNRIVINNHLRRSRGGKISFTHLIGYAIIMALAKMPAMNSGYAEIDGKPNLVKPPHVNLGLAIDLVKPDGTRQLVVPAIKAADTLDFAHFWGAYEDIVRRARNNKLTVDDYSGVTISLTNPGTIGTVHSVPRLMKGQGVIIGVGALEYPAEFQGASPETLSRLGISKIMTLTSTYDHRIIQGAQSGDFLRIVHDLMLGGDEFYDDVFRALRIPYEPIRWASDVAATHEVEVGKQARVLELIHAYRVRGHLMADTDPLEYRQRSHPDLDIGNHGLTLWDLDREFATGSFGDKPLMLLRDILGVLRDSYCRTVGVEYMHIQEPDERRWIQRRVETPVPRMEREDQLRRLHKLNQAEAFEAFLQTKYVGQKRFSLEGAEAVIPLVDEICEAAAEAHLVEVCIGMAHRGRLNVLANIVGKSYSQIFNEFEGNIDPRTVQGSGDVKYHLGADGVFTAETGDTINISLAANPSHLETVNPVVEGIVRAKQDILNRGGAEFPVLPLLIHGDAAFAGQGVVAETLNLSQLRGYRTGGTVHVVVNNQVGFTTSPAASRSSLYATDVARMIQAPIFHVNGDDPEACARIARLAFAFRQEFNKDVVIDLICYRKRGHNEGDDPSMTQPLMYDLIEQKRTVRKLYTEALVGRGDISIEDAEQAMRDFQQQLESAFIEVRQATSHPKAMTIPAYPEKPATAGGFRTSVAPEVLKKIADAHVSFPDGFQPHPKVLPALEKRAAMLSSGDVDWATAEIVAFGSLLLEGRVVRLAGQDSRRGTFVQRFAIAVDRRTGAEYTPLAHLSDSQATFHVIDSLLSEYAAMGFEYGYSVARPDALVLWEAQFGDFVDGAQTVIDEYISSGEAKWNQRSGVVLLLPHGLEGQGPDHSSARIERFLQMCADGSMTVAHPSSPANYFHLLRRQALEARHRPLIVFTPKSMLRLKTAVSALDEFTSGAFRPVIHDEATADPASVRRVVMTSGKLSWQLLAERTTRHADDVAILRIEQLYPLATKEIADIAEHYPNAELVWVQDEPENYGAWAFMAMTLAPALGGRVLHHVTRPPSAAPSVGSGSVHATEQKRLVEQAFGPLG